MRTVLKIVAAAIILGFVGIQFFGINTTTDAVVQDQTLEAAVSVPPQVSEIFARSCNDCHSNATRYPWYAHIQPSGWLLGSHIAEGRQHLNFSIFNTYNSKKKQQKLDQICEHVEGREMPLPSYLWIHWDAELSDADIKTVCDWANAEQAKIPEQ